MRTYPAACLLGTQFVSTVSSKVTFSTYANFGRTAGSMWEPSLPDSFAMLAWESLV